MDEQELVKAGLETVTEPTRIFLEKVSGTPGVELGEMFGDRLRFRRFRNAVRMATKAQEFAAAHGIDPEAVPLRTLFPILEGASLEEDESMTERWAALLATASREPGAVPAAYPEILRQLEPVEARTLELLAENYENTVEGWDDYDLTEKLGAKVRAVNVQNLVRLGLCHYPPPPRADSGPQPDAIQHNKIVVDDLGLEFLKACRPPD